MKFSFILFALFLLVSSCDTSLMTETSDDAFIGKWKLMERGLLDGIEINISKTESGKFTGSITKLNGNKYVNLFMAEGDKIVSSIKRKSNAEFSLSEKKIASALFSTYGISTSTKFAVRFSGPDTILLGKNGVDGYYLRID